MATVMMAGFLGLLWRGEPPGPAVDAPDSVTAKAPPAVPVAAVAREAAGPAADSAVPRPAPVAKSTAAAPAIAQVSRAREAGVRGNTSATEAPAMGEPAVAQAQALDTQSPARGATADSVGTPPPVPVLAAPVLAASPSRPALMAQAARAPAAAPHLLSLPVLQPGDVLSWQTPSQAAAPDLAWMQQLASLTADRWLAEGRSPPADSAALRIERGNTTLGLLRLGSGAVWWCPTGQSCLLAQVPPAALSELIGELPGAR